MSIKVLDGTPQHGGKGLCHSCKHSHVFRAAAESDVTVMCQVSPDGRSMRIHKPVVQCSEYSNKMEKSLYEMKQIGWILATKNGKPIGFMSAREAERRSKNEEIDDVDPD